MDTSGYAGLLENPVEIDLFVSFTKKETEQ